MIVNKSNLLRTMIVNKSTNMSTANNHKYVYSKQQLIENNDSQQVNKYVYSKQPPQLIENNEQW